MNLELQVSAVMASFVTLFGRVTLVGNECAMSMEIDRRFFARRSMILNNFCVSSTPGHVNERRREKTMSLSESALKIASSALGCFLVDNVMSRVAKRWQSTMIEVKKVFSHSRHASSPRTLITAGKSPI